MHRLCQICGQIKQKKPALIEDLVQILNCFEGVGIYWVQRAQAADIDDGLGGGRMLVGHAILLQLKVTSLRAGSSYMSTFIPMID